MDKSKPPNMKTTVKKAARPLDLEFEIQE